MNRSLLGVLLFIVPFCISSCSPGKMFKRKKNRNKDTTAVQVNADTTRPVATIPAAETPKKDTVTDLKLATETLKKLIDELTPVWTKRLDYKTFSGKAKMSFDGPNGSFDCTANFRIRKDSVIWIQITALGGMISAARIFVTQDSFFMLNYQQREATAIALKDAAKTLPTAVDFTQLQNLIVGEPLRNGNITDLSDLPGTWNITVDDTNYTQHITYNKADSTMTAGQLGTHKPDGPKAMVDYSNYELISNRKISTNRAIRVMNGQKNYEIDLNFVNAEFDKELEYPFSIPKHFTIKNPTP